jgi:hypothetical protein
MCINVKRRYTEMKKQTSIIGRDGYMRMKMAKSY